MDLHRFFKDKNPSVRKWTCGLTDGAHPMCSMPSQFWVGIKNHQSGPMWKFWVLWAYESLMLPFMKAGYFGLGRHKSVQVITTTHSPLFFYRGHGHCMDSSPKNARFFGNIPRICIVKSFHHGGTITFRGYAKSQGRTLSSQSWKWKTTPNEKKLLLEGTIIFHFHVMGRSG